MIKLIIGQNGSGKTLYLKNKISEIPTEEIVVSNLDDSYKELEYDKNKIDDICYLFDLDELILNSDIEVDEIKLSDYFKHLLDLLIRKGDILILDEPEYCLKGGDMNRLVNVLNMLAPYYKDVYISTHNQLLFFISHVKIYKVINNSELVEVESGKQYETID